MNSFHFEGRLAADPDFTKGEGNKSSRIRMRLIRDEYAGRDGAGNTRDKTVAIPVTAFGGMAETIAEHVRKGDQLIVTTKIENNRFTDGGGVERFDYNFVLQDFAFGAPGEVKRRELAARRTDRDHA